MSPLTPSRHIYAFFFFYSFYLPSRALFRWRSQSRRRHLNPDHLLRLCFILRWLTERLIFLPKMNKVRAGVAKKNPLIRRSTTCRFQISISTIVHVQHIAIIRHLALTIPVLARLADSERARVRATIP